MNTPLRPLAFLTLFLSFIHSAAASPGGLDASFDPNLNGSVYGLAVQPDGKIVLGGYFTTVGGVTRNYVARLNSNGTLDTAFNPNANNGVNCVIVQTDGKILLGGQFTSIGGVTRNNLARVDANGVLETAFNPNANIAVLCMALQADGKILIGGEFTNVGGAIRNRLARLNADGTLDSSFNPNVNSDVNTVAVQEDGKIVFGGIFTTVGGITRNRLARLNADGTLDTINPNVNAIIDSIVVQADGKIVIGGNNFTTVGGVARNRIARLNADGTLDTLFDPGALNAVDSMSVETDGKIVIGGSFTSVGGGTRNRIARLNADGTLDAGFNPNANDLANSVAVQVGGKIVAGGAFTTISGGARNRIARLENDPATQSLTVVNSTSVQWLRGGTSPESLQVTFELSVDNGTTWTLLGTGTRVAGGWTLTGLSLPNAGQIRGRARTTSGHFNGSSGLTETVASFSTCIPEILVRGLSITILNGDSTPTGGDNTDFSDVAVCGGTKTHAFTIYNFGKCPLTVTNIVSSNPSEFTVGSMTFPVIIAAGGAWADFSVTFDPSGPGARTTTLSIASDDSTANPYNFALGGNGIITPSQLVFTCATNKTVNCRTTWNFDPPTASEGAGAPKVPVTILTTVTNGACPQVVTRTWQAVDACGNTNTCNQSVTVVDTTPPLLICATNKTILCGTAWSFDPPTVTDTCSGTNVTLAVLSTVTNGFCPLVITRTWLATDACTNTATCSQTVTVLDTTPITLPVSGFANIFGAGHTTPPNPGGGGTGILPPSYSFSAGPGKVLRFSSVTGTASLSTNLAFSGADGYLLNLPTDINSFNGMSGIRHDGASFLVGVFLDSNTPSSSAPARLDFRASALGTNFTQLAPTIGQTFFIGDGRTGTGLVQQFEVPPNATRLFLGFADAPGYQGDPGQYEDNGGLLTAAFEIKEAIICATNKTVNCGTVWEFDPPIVIPGCSGTSNLTPVVLSTVTNGVCPQVITRMWQAVDACGSTNTCSQTVTVLANSPPVLTCATNKTVNCGTAWTFDPPIALDSCSGTNVTLTILNTVTNGICPMVITRTWRAIDACTNSATCSQTVTVIDSTPPVLACANQTASIFSLGTTNDDFAGPEPAFPSAGLVQRLGAAGVTNFKGIDDCAINTFFAHTFTNLPSCITKATLHVRFRACGGQLNDNDSFGLSFTTPSGVLLQPGWGRYLGNGNASPGLFNISWGAGLIREVVLDLSQLPNADGSSTDLISTLNAQGFLDLVLQDDSSIDFAVLSIASCCSADKTVECGTAWTFDPPIAIDSCSGTNVTVAILNTVTNGVCPMRITRTWQATDACSNAATYSQTVTVLDITPPVLTCATNKTVNCGTAWTFDPPVVLGSCSGTNVTLTILNTVTNGICPMVITRTWRATDACTNSAICSQTVTVLDITPPVLTCATNKTVNCGAAWKFDPPSVTDSCSGTNISVAILSTVTNGIDPMFITRTWLALDACGNTNTCSQIVTVLRDAPPTIICPPDITVNTIGTNAVVNYPNPSVVGGSFVSSTPASGSVFTLGTTVVNCTATNACGTGTCTFKITVININCETGPNLVVNGNFESTSPTVAANSSNNALNPNTGVPGWMTSSGNFLEIWSNNAGFPASLGTNQLELNAQSADQIVSQVITGLKTNCPATFCFDYTGRFRLADGTFNNDFTVSLSGAHTLSMPLNPATHGVGGWTNFCVTFIPTSPTITIAFEGRPHFSDGSAATQGGAHIDNVSLTQCCSLKPCITLACPTDKRVSCGTPWKFDLPLATSCCGTNVSIKSTGIVTNGVCPQIITQRWLITDDCGNTATCSQTVTVFDTTPPVVVCITNRVTVALNANCQLEIPTLRPTASDNCTPTSQLVYSQDPRAGTVVDGPCRLVTVTVKDACDNVGKCEVLVCGQDKTPPTILYPKSIVATNCFVPNALALISAYDNCTLSNKLVFAQSPPAGTAIAAGGNVVSVTATDEAGNTTTALIPLTSSGQQSFLSALFNTGVDNNKTVLPGGSVDPHYTFRSLVTGISSGLVIYNPPDALVVTTPWGLPPYTSSRWIAPGVPREFPDGSEPLGFPNGNYIYTNRFVLPVGADPLSASISGRWAADDGAGMYLNGQTVADLKSAMPSSSPSGYTQWTYFTINNGFLGFPAVNQLYFTVTNLGSPTGLRVEFTNAVINCSTCSPPAIVQQSPDQTRPLHGIAVFDATVWGTPPLTFQWYRNGLPLSNSGHFFGVNTSTLVVTSLSYSEAGVYYLAVSNACGQASSRPRKLTVTKGWPWEWSWWNFSRLERPFAAALGPDIILSGTNGLGISSGTTFDFGLPNIGGRIANVTYVPPLINDTFLKVPWATLNTNSNPNESLTLMMDILVPGDSNPTLFSISNRWANLKLKTAPGVAGQGLVVQGFVNDLPVNLISTMSLRSNTWYRIALRSRMSANEASASGALDIFVNGKPAGNLSFSSALDALILDPDSIVTVLSSPDGSSGGCYVSDIQFHLYAMSEEMLASFSGPNESPMPSYDSSFVNAPALSAANSNGAVNLSWTGLAFHLQESPNLDSGVWVESLVPFDQAETNGEIVITARPNPGTEGTVKFYRLIWMP